MSYCNFCNINFDKDIKICPVCGNLVKQDSFKLCPICFNKNPVDGSFCLYCGTNLKNFSIKRVELQFIDFTLEYNIDGKGYNLFVLGRKQLKSEFVHKKHVLIYFNSSAYIMDIGRYNPVFLNSRKIDKFIFYKLNNLDKIKISDIEGRILIYYADR